VIDHLTERTLEQAAERLLARLRQLDGFEDQQREWVMITLSGVYDMGMRAGLRAEK
jgi:hypothetical protein